MVDEPRIFEFSIAQADVGQRLDVFLAAKDPPGISRSQVKKRLNRHEITVNGDHTKAGHFLRRDDAIRWTFQPPQKPSLRAQPIPIDLLYGDRSLAVVDKPAGMVVHPAPGHPDGTLVNALLDKFDDLAGIGGELRPGIVHRIDKDTSGALAVTKTDRAHRCLADQFRAHTTERTYHALVFGPGLADEGAFESYHARDPNNRYRYTGRIEAKRRAITHWAVAERFPNGVRLVECWLETGRTHQIRMHFFEANAPLLGDQVYGGKNTSDTGLIDRQALHARELGFDHPNGDHIHCQAPYPDDFASALQALRAGKDWR